MDQEFLLKTMSELKNKFSVLLIDDDGSRTLATLRCFGEYRNIKVHVVAFSPRPSRYSSHCHTFQIISFQKNEEFLLEKILEVARKREVDIIFPTSKGMITFFARNGEIAKKEFHLSLIPTLENFIRADNKEKLARFMINAGVSCPKTHFFRNGSPDWEAIEKFQFPGLLKIHTGSGGKNFFKVEGAEHLKQLVAEHQLDLRDFILQEFIAEGYDISFSTLCKDGELLAYTIWKEFKPVRPDIKNYKTIVDLLDYYHDDQLKLQMDHLFKQLNWNGLANVNLRYDESDGKIKVLEINPRVWNSLMGSQFVGVNFPYLTCLASLGIKFDLPTYRDGHFFMKHFLSNKKHKKGLGKPYEIKKSRSIYILKDPVPTFVEAFWRLIGYPRISIPTIDMDMDLTLEQPEK